MIRSVLVAAALFLPALPSAAQEARWCTVELRGGERFTARLVSEEADSYLLTYQGLPLRVPRSRVVRMERPVPPQATVLAKARAWAGMTAPAAPPPVPRGSKSPSGEELQDALETLASADDGAVLDAFRTLSESFPGTRALIHAALSHRSPRVRTLAVKLLGEKGSVEDDLDRILPSLDDARPEVRLAAVRAVRELGPSGLPALLKSIPGEEEAGIRKLAVKTIEHWRDRRALGPLVERLAAEPDQGCRGFIVSALETIAGVRLGADPQAWETFLMEDRLANDAKRLTGGGTIAAGAVDERAE